WAMTAAGPRVANSAAGVLDSRTKTRTGPLAAPRDSAIFARSATCLSRTGLARRSCSSALGRVRFGRVGPWALATAGTRVAISRADAPSATSDRRIMSLPFRRWWPGLLMGDPGGPTTRTTRSGAEGFRGRRIGLPQDPPRQPYPRPVGRSITGTARSLDRPSARADTVASRGAAGHQ